MASVTPLSEDKPMAAKTFWNRTYVDNIVSQLRSAMVNSYYDLTEAIEEIVVCGDIRRDPNAQQVRHLCLVVITRDDASIPDMREKIKSNVRHLLLGSDIRGFKAYDFVVLPDGSGNISWLLVPRHLSGAAMVHATGPIEYVKYLEAMAKSKGMVFSASGLKVNESKVPTLSEESLYEALGLMFVPPERRIAMNS
jgi:DNA polymerase/3'-5' exonuclease PolX